MGSTSRKFLSLIVNEKTPGFKTLRCIDLTLQKLFYDAPAAARDDAAATSRRPPPAIGRVCLPGPSFTFRPGDSDERDAWGMHCFPLRDRSVVCVDQSGLAVAFDGETRVVGTITEKGGRGGAKRMPLSLPSFSRVEIPASLDSCLCDEAIFVMERFPDPEPEEKKKKKTKTRQFEAFFKINYSGYWMRRLLPPPPFAVGQSVEITAYAAVGLGSRCVRNDGTHYFDGGSCICVSAAGAGTYCMNTAPSHTWTHVANWTLPFAGKVEHVPELNNLWFGFTAGDESRRLAAADLSGVGSRKMAASEEPPQLVGTWQELDPPEDWKECRDPQMVNLGSGRFCIARFFRTTSDGSSSSDDGETGEDFAVLTGVELVPCLDDDSEAKGGKGKVMKLRMIRHKSSRLHGGGTIDIVF